MDLERNLKSLQSRSLLDYMERGVRILACSFRHSELGGFRNKRKSSVPTNSCAFRVNKGNIRQPYSIAVPPVEDEAVLNPALQAKLKNDYKIELPPLPEEWEEQKLADYFKLVEQAVAEMGWKTEPSVDLGLFSFQKLVIYKDLESTLP